VSRLYMGIKGNNRKGHCDMLACSV
jgi:hypothetical protein